MASFDGSTGRHALRFAPGVPAPPLPPSAALVSSSAESNGPTTTTTVVEVLLSASRFKWLSAPPASSAPNPTHCPLTHPAGEGAVGQRIRVFWPGMGRWYSAKVVSFVPEPAASKKASSSSSSNQNGVVGGTHRVAYPDGDSHELCLRHEAVVFAGVAPPRTAWPEGDKGDAAFEAAGAGAHRADA